jgi:hypothetical protein
MLPKPLSFVTHFHFAVRVEPKTTQHPVTPILAKLLNERYEPVARAAEGVIYRMR